MPTPETASASSAAGPSPSLVNRYGRPKRRLSKRAATILIAVGVVLLVLAALFLSQRSTRSYEPKDVAFDIVSERRTDVTVAVSMPRGEQVTCGVRVLSEDKAVVGYTEVEFDSADGVGVGGNLVAVQHKVPIRTVFVGVNGGAAACWQTQK